MGFISVLLSTIALHISCFRLMCSCNRILVYVILFLIPLKESKSIASFDAFGFHTMMPLCCSRILRVPLGGQTFLDLTCFGWPWQFWLHRAFHGFVWLPAPPLPLKVRLSLQREQGSWPAQDSTQVEQWVQRCWGWHWNWSAAGEDSLPCSYSLSPFHTMPMEGGHSAAHSWGARSSVPPSSPYRCYAYWSLCQNM